MDDVLQKLQPLWDMYDSATEFIDSCIPSPIPVPPLMNSAAMFLSRKATSYSFPYDISRIDLGDIVFWQALLAIFLQPTIWNLIGRLEYYTRLVSKIFFKPIFGVYAFALWIFLAGLYRDLLFVEAIKRQRTSSYFDDPYWEILGYVTGTVGVVLVLSSFWQLGMTGTYLGDYFGILMEKRVTAFPFNYFSDPMYDGSSLIFLSKALL